MQDENLLNTCAICGKKFKGLGHSTWGFWSKYHGTEDDSEIGEKMRCCDNCNTFKVIPARKDS